MSKLAPYSKAIVAFIAPLVVGYVAKYGLETDVDQVVLIITAILTSAGVYAKANAPDPENKAE